MDERLKLDVQKGPTAKEVSLYTVRRVGSQAVFNLLLVGIPIKEDGEPDLRPGDWEPFVTEVTNGAEFLFTDKAAPPELTDLSDDEDQPNTIELFDGRLKVKEGEREVVANDEDLKLTKIEFNLLSYLSRFPNMVHSRKRLLESVWGRPFPSGTRTVDQHIINLREKLNGLGPAVKTIRCIGYMLDTRTIPDEIKE